MNTDFQIHRTPDLSAISTLEGLEAEQSRKAVARDAAVEAHFAGEITLVELLYELVPPWEHDCIEGALSGDIESAATLGCMEFPVGDVLAVLFEMQIPRDAFRAFLGSAWEMRHHQVVHVCSGFSPWMLEMDDLFYYADFPLPDHLPERLTVWRGTSIGMEDLGYSWTTDRDMACWFAVQRSNMHDSTADPVLIRAEIDRSDVAMYTDGRSESEIVLIGTPDYTVDGTPAEWDAAARR